VIESLQSKDFPSVDLNSSRLAFVESIASMPASCNGVPLAARLRAQLRDEHRPLLQPEAPQNAPTSSRRLLHKVACSRRHGFGASL